MRRLAASALVLALAAPAYAQPAGTPKPAAQARCHAADGKAKACPKAPRKASTAAGGSSFLRCRDVVSHRFTRCGGPNAEPVPAE